MVKRVAGILVCLWACRCAAVPPEVPETLVEFMESVQSEDLADLRCLLTDAARADPAEFEAWARSRYRNYLEGRDAGGVNLGDDGIVLVKAFALGKGTFYEIVSSRRRGGEALVVDTRVRFAYARIDVSELPPGAVFYVCGAPPGRIEPVKVPAGRETVEVEVLETIRVRWTLERSPARAGCPERWTVSSAVPVEGSATTSLVTWVF